MGIERDWERGQTDVWLEELGSHVQRADTIQRPALTDCCFMRQYTLSTPEWTTVPVTTSSSGRFVKLGTSWMANCLCALDTRLAATS